MLFDSKRIIWKTTIMGASDEIHHQQKMIYTKVSGSRRHHPCQTFCSVVAQFFHLLFLTYKNILSMFSGSEIQEWFAKVK